MGSFGWETLTLGLSISLCLSIVTNLAYISKNSRSASLGQFWLSKLSFLQGPSCQRLHLVTCCSPRMGIVDIVEVVDVDKVVMSEGCRIPSILLSRVLGENLDSYGRWSSSMLS